jgi:hypothetical protein
MSLVGRNSLELGKPFEDKISHPKESLERPRSKYFELYFIAEGRNFF